MAELNLGLRKDGVGASSDRQMTTAVSNGWLLPTTDRLDRLSSIQGISESHANIHLYANAQASEDK